MWTRTRKAKLRTLPSNDDFLANVLKKSRVILGQSGILLTTAPDPSAPQTGIATRGPDPSAFLVTFPGLLRNVPVLEQAAAGRGLLTIRNERDGIVRRVPVVVKAGGIVAPALTLEMLRVVTNSGAILVNTDAAGVRSVAIPGLEIPTDRSGQLWIHFGPHDPVRYVSAKDVIEGRLPADKVAGKLVLVGTSAVGLLDIKTTPLDPAMPGVEIHAQILETGAVARGAVAPELGGRGRARHRPRRGRDAVAARSGAWRRRLAGAHRRDGADRYRPVLVFVHMPGECCSISVSR